MAPWIERLRNRNPTLARAACIIAADRKQAAEVLIALPKAVYPLRDARRCWLR